MKDFDDLKKVLRTARDPVKGKPDGNNTRVRVAEGTASDPEVIAVKFHNTDILRFYPDGRLDLVTGWEKSPTTNQRIRQYANIYRRKQKLPTFNGRLPDPSSVYCVSHAGSGHIVSNAVDGYIRYHPDRTIDLDSVKAQEFWVWKDQRTHRKLMAKGRAICEHVEFMQRMGYQFTKNEASGETADWLEANLDTPLEQIDFAQIPLRGSTFTGGRMDLRATLYAISLTVARHRDCLEVIELKKF